MFKKFKERYHVFSDIDIDGEGIHDGFLTYHWDDIETCVIGKADINELKWYFGDDFKEHPYSLTIIRKKGSTREMTLFGQDWDKVIEMGKAINHYSGREIFSPDQLKGEPVPIEVFIILGLFLLSVIAIFVVHALQQ